MEGLALTVSTSSTATSTSSSSSLIFSKFRNPICSFPFSIRKGRRGVRISGDNGLCCRRFVVSASKDEPKLDPLDLMELKFGRLLGEDPNLTISKILARKANPDADYLEVEKSFYKNKGKIVEIKNIPLDWSKDAQSTKSLDGMSLARPVPKNGFEYKIDDFKPAVPKMKRPIQPASKPAEGVKRSVPNVILRKPSMINEPDVEDNRARFRLRPNLSLTMRNQPAKEEFSDMTLLRKPEPMSLNESTNTEEERRYDVGDFTLLNRPRTMAVETELEIPEDDLSDVGTGVLGDFTLSNKPKATVVETKLEIPEDKLSESVSVETDVLSDFTLLNKPKATVVETELENPENEVLKSVSVETDILDGLEDSSDLVEDSNATPDSDDSLLTEKPTRLQPDEQSISNANFSGEAALIGRPKRLDQSLKQTSVTKPGDFEILQAKEGEDIDWNRAENLVLTGERGHVELISCSARGFAVSFGSLVGFLPYRNLSSKWKFLAFESWLRRKGLDPALYRQSLGIIGNYDASNYNTALDSVVDSSENTLSPGRKVSADMNAEDLLNIYDEEKKKFLSSFLGQKVKVNVVLANRKSRKLLFSVKPKEKDELIERKRNLMAKLQVGDVVKCCIKKITYFGIFVEIEEVPALIHQTEVSWDATLDPSAYFKVGQIVQAKVHQLDFSLDRIFLSLKEIMPDPLVDALESVVGDRDPLDSRLQVAEEDTEWTVVESLIKELQEVEGIESVSKGRFFSSPGLAPTFQVYMASMFEDQYKLLARSGNKVQEVIIKTSLGKEDLKSVILSCTNKVE